MKYYTIGKNKNTIYAGDVNDGHNDIVKYYAVSKSGRMREFPNNDSHCDYECFNALKTGQLHIFNSFEEAEQYVRS